MRKKVCAAVVGGVHAERMGTRKSLTALVRARLQQLKIDKRLNQTALATALALDPSAVSKTISLDERAITLEFLEAVAEQAQIPVAELVCPEGDIIKQLNPDEAAIFRYVRQWPPPVRLALLQFLNYWADETPAETQTRSLHEIWRKLNPTDRGWLHWLALELSESNVAPDLRDAVSDRVLRASKHREGPPKGTRRTP